MPPVPFLLEQRGTGAHGCRHGEDIPAQPDTCSAGAVPAVRHGHYCAEMVYRMFSGALDGQVTALNGHGAQITQIGTMKTEERQYGEIFNNKKSIL